MELTTLIYLADIVTGLAGFIGTLGAVIAIPSVIIAFSSASDEEFTITKVSSIFVFLGLSLILVATLIPSKQAIYMIFGAEVAQKVAATPEAKEIGDKLLKLANSKLDEALQKK